MKPFIKIALFLSLIFSCHLSNAQNKIKNDEDLRRAIGWILKQQDYLKEVSRDIYGDGSMVLTTTVTIHIDLNTYLFSFREKLVGTKSKSYGEFSLYDVTDISSDFFNNAQLKFKLFKDIVVKQSDYGGDYRDVEYPFFLLNVKSKDNMPERMKKAFKDIISYLHEKKYGDSENMY